MTVSEMAERFNAYDKETHAFIFGEWLNLSVADRDSRQAEIDTRHGYKHGWIIADGLSFDRFTAFPGCTFANVWD